ncbi:ABC transporter permease subunit [SAR202 cluster bacterium AC-647-N09_OGT_505m]|nr:ABC transporter permease subunit [SAR202 cluster bacterium AC-647-N09_OGT_505m]
MEHVESRTKLTARRLKRLILFTSLIATYGIAYALFKRDSQTEGASFPYVIDKNIIDEIGDGFKRVGESASWLFDPIAAFINLLVAIAETSLMALPWITILFVISAIAFRFSGLKLAALCIGSLTFVSLIGLWNSLLITSSLMLTSVSLALCIGIPFGIAAGLSDRFERITRPVLDVMQVMPSFVYLIPALILFGVGSAVSVALTVIYSVPPTIRLTNLGIRTVPSGILETARSYGSTRRQTLFQVQLPLAKPSIMMGVNQTIMMALAMVIITAVVGSSGLGRDVWYALRTINTGTGLEAGMAIVIIAVLLDRISYALASNTRNRRAMSISGSPFAIYAEAAWDRVFGRMARVFRVKDNRLFGFIFLTLVITGIARISQFENLPQALHFSFANPVNSAVDWATIHLHFITSWLRDSVIREFALGPIDSMLVSMPWWLFLIAIVGIAYMRGGVGVAILAFAGTLFLALTGIWEEAMETLSQVLTSVVIATVIGITIGILASQSNAMASWLRPILDTMQTMPVFVYLIPVIMLWSSGPIASVIATVIYAMPPAIRMTDLGIRLVSGAFIETAESYGANRWQILRGIQLPLAAPTIMVGINQCVMMTLAMVIVGGLVGGGGLGQEVYVATLYLRMGDGLISGFGIVILAMILDRSTQSNKRQEGIIV